MSSWWSVALMLLVACGGSGGSAGSGVPKDRAASRRPDPGLPVAPSLTSLDGAPAVAREIAADEPLGQWRLARGGSVAPAMTLGGLDDAGGSAFTVEMWLEGARGELLSYSTEAQADAVRLSLGASLDVTVAGEKTTTVPIGGAGWRHVGVSWSSIDGAIRVYLDGRLAHAGTLAKGKAIGGPGVAVVGSRQKCWGGCLEGALTGSVGDVAWHAAELGSGRMLSRVLVERGEREPTPPASTLPLQFRLGAGLGTIPESIAFSPEGRFAVSGGGEAVRLWDVALGRLVYDLRGHRGRITAVAYDPAGRYVASAAEESRVIVWDTATGKPAHHLEGHRHHVSEVVFSGDGRRVLSGSYDKTARIWNPATGKLVHELDVKDRVKRVALSADGRWAATSKGDDTVVLWNAETGARVRELVGGKHAIALLFVGDGGMLLGGFEDAVAIWETTTGKLLRQLEVPGGERLNLSSLFVDRRGRRVLGSTTKHGRIWDLENGKLLHTLSGHDTAVRAAGFSPNDGTVATVSTDQTLRLWDAASGRQLHALRHEAGVHSAAFGPEGRTILSGGADRKVRLWDLVTGRLLGDMQMRTSSTNLTALSRDERRLFVSSGKAVVEWRLDAAHMGGQLIEHPMFVTAIAPSDDGKRVLSRGGDVRIWDAASGGLIHRLQIDGNGIAAWNGRHVAAVNGANEVVVWDATTGAKLHTLKAAGESVFDLAMSPDGRHLAVGGGRIARSGEAIVWELATGRRVHELVNDKEAVRGLAYSPDGKLLAAVGLGNRVEVYDTGTGQRLHRLEGHKHWVLEVAFSRDGKSMVTASEDATALVWDPIGGRLVASLKGHQRAVRQATFSPDGQRVLTASEDGEVILWDARSGKRLRDFRGDVPELASVAFGNDGRFAVSGSIDGAKIWSTTGEHALTMTSRGDDWLVYTEDGLFDSSPDGVRLVSLGQGKRVFGADQLALTNNRPDVILERFGFGVADLRAHFKRRHVRRLQKAGLRDADVGGRPELPQARIVSSRRGAEGKQTLSVDLFDRRGLKSWQVYVNDVPIFPGGRPASGTRVRVGDDVHLTPGRNKIEVSALNVAGQESLRALEIVDHDDKSLPDLWFVGFGVSRYKNPKLDLAYAEKDVRDLAQVFAKMSGYGRVHVTTLSNEQVTTTNIEAAGAALAKARPRDTLVLFVAGHGIHDRDEDATYYYVTHDADPKNLSKTAASFETIEKLLYDAAPRSKLFLLDTCESGEADDAYGAPAPPRAGARGVKARAVRGLKLETGATSKPKPRPWLLHRERLIEADLTRRSGAIVFSSSRGGEFSYESDELQNGNFTEELIKALTSAVADENRDRRVGTDELRRYVSRAVAAATGDLQHPTVDRDNIHQKLAFPIVSGP